MLKLFSRRPWKIGDPIAHFIKITLLIAVQQRATKIVFGEPYEVGAKRIPRDLIRAQEIAREMARDLGPHLHPIEVRTIPHWIKAGDVYTEQSPLPAHVFIRLLALLQRWNGLKLEHEEPWRDKPKRRDRVPTPPDISAFEMWYADGRAIRAALGFEPNYCFSIAIEYLDNKI